MRAIKIELIKCAIELSGAWFPFLTTKPVTNVQHYPLKLFWRLRRRFSWNFPIDLGDNHLCLPLLYLPPPPPFFCSISLHFFLGQGVKLRLLQVPMRLNFSLWRPNPGNYSPNWRLLERFSKVNPRQTSSLSLFPKRSTCSRSITRRHIGSLCPLCSTLKIPNLISRAITA